MALDVFDPEYAQTPEGAAELRRLLLSSAWRFAGETATGMLPRDFAAEYGSFWRSRGSGRPYEEERRRWSEEYGPTPTEKRGNAMVRHGYNRSGAPVMSFLDQRPSFPSYYRDPEFQEGQEESLMDALGIMGGPRVPPGLGTAGRTPRQVARAPWLRPALPELRDEIRQIRTSLTGQGPQVSDEMATALRERKAAIQPTYESLARAEAGERVLGKRFTEAGVPLDAVITPEQEAAMVAQRWPQHAEFGNSLPQRAYDLGLRKFNTKQAQDLVASWGKTRPRVPNDPPRLFVPQEGPPLPEDWMQQAGALARERGLAPRDPVSAAAQRRSGMLSGPVSEPVAPRPAGQQTVEAEVVNARPVRALPEAPADLGDRAGLYRQHTAERVAEGPNVADFAGTSRLDRPNKAALMEYLQGLKSQGVKIPPDVLNVMDRIERAHPDLPVDLTAKQMAELRGLAQRGAPEAPLPKRLPEDVYDPLKKLKEAGPVARDTATPAKRTGGPAGTDRPPVEADFNPEVAPTDPTNASIATPPQEGRFSKVEKPDLVRARKKAGTPAWAEETSTPGQVMMKDDSMEAMETFQKLPEEWQNTSEYSHSRVNADGGYEHVFKRPTEGGKFDELSIPASTKVGRSPAISKEQQRRIKIVEGMSYPGDPEDVVSPTRATPRGDVTTGPNPRILQGVAANEPTPATHAERRSAKILAEQKEAARVAEIKRRQQVNEEMIRRHDAERVAEATRRAGAKPPPAQAPAPPPVTNEGAESLQAEADRLRAENARLAAELGDAPSAPPSGAAPGQPPVAAPAEDPIAKAAAARAKAMGAPEAAPAKAKRVTKADLQAQLEEARAQLQALQQGGQAPAPQAPQSAAPAPAQAAPRPAPAAPPDALSKAAAMRQEVSKSVAAPVPAGGVNFTRSGTKGEYLTPTGEKVVRGEDGLFHATVDGSDLSHPNLSGIGSAYRKLKGRK